MPSVIKCGLQTSHCTSRSEHGAGRPYHGVVACPLWQLQEHWHFPYLAREQHAKPTASAGVTDVTCYT